MFTVSEDGETIGYRVQVDEIIKQVYDLEEKYFREVVVMRMRSLGYTVIAP